MVDTDGAAGSDFLRARETGSTNVGVFLGCCETGGTSVGVFLGCCETVGTFVGGNWLFFG